MKDSYLQLVSTLSQYSTYDYDGDESEEYRFIETCLVAQALVRYAIYTDGAMRENGVFAYNVYKGDFSEVLKLAIELASV